MRGVTSADGAYRTRLADHHLTGLLADIPAVMLTGARATGKTTTALQRGQQTDKLGVPGAAAAYRADPDAALRRAARPLLLDEWQEVPEVLAAVKRVVDVDSTPGRFLLTGSVRAELTNERWAGTGRVIRLPMYGLTERELHDRLDPTRPGFLTRLAATGLADLRLPKVVPDLDGYVRLALRSGFPELAYRERAERSTGVWLSSYLDDLVTRDAAVLDQRKDPAKLRRYLQVLALKLAGMPTEASLYGAAGLNARTAAGYDQLLKNLHVLDKVPAWSTNRFTSLVKGPKRYLLDPGLAAAAAGLTGPDVLGDPDLVGRFFDAFGTAQIRPEIALAHPRPSLHHLRERHGRKEVDLVVDMGAGRVVGLEFKAGTSPGARDARHLAWLRDELGRDFLAGAVLHSGPGLYELGDRLFAVPLCALWG